VTKKSAIQPADVNKSRVVPLNPFEKLKVFQTNPNEPKLQDPFLSCPLANNHRPCPSQVSCPKDVGPPEPFYIELNRLKLAKYGSGSDLREF